MKDLGIVVEGKRLADGALELAFSRVNLGFTGWLCTIRKEVGEPVEDADFLREPAISAPWMFRIIHGLGKLSPVLRITDSKGNSVWFYHGWDRKQRERIYLCARSVVSDSGGDMLIDRESFASMFTQLKAMTGQAN